MNNRILKNLFAEDPAKQTRGQVMSKIGPGLWRVRADNGHIAAVTSDRDWQPGIDWVVIQGGRIIARATAAREINVYEV